MPSLTGSVHSTSAHFAMAISMTGTGHAGSSGVNTTLHVQGGSEGASHRILSLTWAVSRPMPLQVTHAVPESRIELKHGHRASLNDPAILLRCALLWRAANHLQLPLSHRNACREHMQDVTSLMLHQCRA